MHSINPLERLHGDIGRRTGAVGIVPDEAAILRLFGAILFERNDDRAVRRVRSITLESISPSSDDPPVELPTVAA